MLTASWKRALPPHAAPPAPLWARVFLRSGSPLGGEAHELGLSIDDGFDLLRVAVVDIRGTEAPSKIVKDLWYLVGTPRVAKVGVVATLELTLQNRLARREAKDPFKLPQIVGNLSHVVFRAERS